MAMSIPRCYYFSPPNLARSQILNTPPVTNPSLKAPYKFSQNPIKSPSIKETCEQGNLKEAFVSFGAFPCTDNCNSVLINQHEVYAPILDLCATKRALLQAQQIHAHVKKSDSVSDSVFLGTKLLFVYGKCGSIVDAEKMFDKMWTRTSFTWNVMMGAYVSNGEPLRAIELYQEMRVLGVPFDSFTFPCVLKACSAVDDIHSGAEIHGLAIRLGCNSNVFVLNSLISMYVKCHDINAARKLFDRINDRNDAVSWNPIISGYSMDGQCMEALRLLREMQKAGVSMNTYTFVAALQACGDSSSRKLGMEMHAAILKSSQVPDVYVSNALISMYARFGKMCVAARIFNGLDEKDNVTWNSMLVGFIQNGLYNEALQFVCALQDANLKPDEVSLITILAASGRLGNLLNGKEIHTCAIKNGVDFNLRVGNTLIDMYSKCCCVDYAGLVFNKMINKDLISWTTMIAAYAQNNCHIEALKMLREVQMEGMDVDTMMMESILLSCCRLKCLSHVKEVHGYTLKQGLSDLILQNMIVDAYGECGNINYAARVFESIKCKDVVSWTSMISSFVHNGLANEALGTFNLMKKAGVEPDSVTLVSILSATASLSTLTKGKETHGFIFRKGFRSEGFLGNSLVDMYARCGSLENAYKAFISTRSKSVVIWTTMINAYGMHGRGKAAVELFDKMEEQKLIPDHITFLTLLYACSHSGLIDEGKRLLETMICKYQLEPWPEHCACFVDLLGRANRLEEAFHFVNNMLIEPTAEVWCALLGACRSHSNQQVGEIATQKLLELDPDSPGSYVLMSNGFAASGRWKDVEGVRMRMKVRGLKKNPGCSWIELGNEIHIFLARDKSHPESDKIYQKLAQITERLEIEGAYVPQTRFVLHNVGEEEKVQMLYGHSERLAIAYGLSSTPEGTSIRITKNLRICGDCHTFCKLVSKFFERKLIVRDASRFHHFECGVCSCGDYW